MKSAELITLINGDKSKLKNWFENFDAQSESINDLQNLLGYPLEPHSCRICQKIRTAIQNGLSHQFGVKHLDGETYPALAKSYFDDAINYIEKGESIRLKMRDVYPEIKALLYTN